ncbi:hypothetical protein QFC22_005200 [Naganishia vaughanmartiniae]|uniref:Uncharacterized protein n=1 Tax=Naganishia vaughanmartiniae TaxID=1424756 RepID=A0ACC2WY88_9TREE|nr:hypothetical protein QFC22_005200 [Naganishia vaughanmartiniae]
MSGSPRHHIVLVPGFGGFDALGQLQYYAGVSEQFHNWQQSRPNGQPPVDLHYFDNLPTASVATRAVRLREYLAKRIARGEFRVTSGPMEKQYPGDDKVFLVGHSTGGLDIRKLLSGLQQMMDRQELIDVDGNEVTVNPHDVLRIVEGVAFLSVPQYGTNVADWVISHRLERQFIAHVAAKVAIKAGQNVYWPLIDRLSELANHLNRQSWSFRKQVYENAAAGGAAFALNVIGTGISSIVHGGVYAANGVIDLGAMAVNGVAGAIGNVSTSVASKLNSDVGSAVKAFTGSAQTLVGAVAGAVTGLTHFLGEKAEDTVRPMELPHLLPQLNFDFTNAIRGIEDSIRESSQSLAIGVIAKTNAREAASQLQFFLDNINDDFGAIEDLRNCWRLPQLQPGHAPRTLPASPAHYSGDERQAEKNSWQQHAIRTLSYATLGNKPPGFANRPGSNGQQSADIWNGLPFSGAYDLNARDGCDSTYLAAYFATAGGLFGGAVGPQTLVSLDGGNLTVPVEQWDNDGIVNTASMLWPNGNQTRLVRGDHGDIIGHYKNVRTAAYARFQDDSAAPQRAPGRRYHRYDIFVSGSNFDDERFKTVWSGVFDFCG